MARFVNVAFLVCLTFVQSLVELVVSSESVVLNSVTITKVPTILEQCSEIVLEIQCTKNKMIGVDVIVQLSSKKTKRIFSTSWRCRPTQGSTRTKSLAVHLVDSAAFRPDCLNRLIIQSEKATVRAWIIELDTWKKRGDASYDFTSVKTSVTVSLAPPYTRKSKASALSFQWYNSHYFRSEQCSNVFCRAEQFIVPLLRQPVVYSSSSQGVHRRLSEYHHHRMRRARQKSLHNPVFTLNVWLYVMEYCGKGQKLCGIIQRITWDDAMPTPLILLTDLGKVHIQLETNSYRGVALLTPFVISRYRWCQLIFGLRGGHWTISLECQGEGIQTTYYESPTNYYYDELRGTYVVGGTELMPSFKGYVGLAELYRGRFLTWSEVDKPASDHPMFNLGWNGVISRRCRRPIRWIDNHILKYRELREKINRARSCYQNWRTVLHAHPPRRVSLLQCSILQMPCQCKYRLIRDIVRSTVFKNQQINLPFLADVMYQNATEIVNEGDFKKLRRLVSVLHSSSCYGNHDATFLLATIFSNGLGVRVNEKLAFLLLLYGAQDRHRLSLLALGNKYYYGLDGLPVDQQKAYFYFKNVADMTQRDREIHRDSDVFFESVYLTDEKRIEEQTDEDGHLFMWMKHQAKQGVTSAQHNLARLMFWGQQGVKRDLKKAAELYKESAIKGGDPVAQLDYGLVLMKGQGVTQNIDEGLRQLELAAAKGRPEALTALGAYYLEQSKDYAKAADNFEKAYRMGNVDAAHNIGHMYQNGKFPNSPIDRMKAYEFFAWAANNNQLESGIMVAMYCARGHPLAKPYSPKYAADWARYIAEMNPALGNLLRRGVKAYRDGQWTVSFLYYVMAAHAGLQVGQFNVAYLTEQFTKDVKRYMRKESMWSNYNLTVLREPQFWNTYSLLKMGDCYWYGCPQVTNVTLSAEFYVQAAIRQEPQGFYNLAQLVEDGAHIPDGIWDIINVPESARLDYYTLLKHLYTRCQHIQGSESYGPCSLSTIRVSLAEFWNEYKLLIKISGVIGFLIATSLFLFALYRHFVSNPSISIGV